MATGQQNPLIALVMNDANNKFRVVGGTSIPWWHIVLKTSNHPECECEVKSDANLTTFTYGFVTDILQTKCSQALIVYVTQAGLEVVYRFILAPIGVDVNAKGSNYWPSSFQGTLRTLANILARFSQSHEQMFIQH